MEPGEVGKHGNQFCPEGYTDSIKLKLLVDSLARQQEQETKPWTRTESLAGDRSPPSARTPQSSAGKRRVNRTRPSLAQNGSPARVPWAGKVTSSLDFGSRGSRQFRVLRRVNACRLGRKVPLL